MRHCRPALTVASLRKMPPLFIRLTREWAVLKDFIENVCCSRIAVYEHTADEEVKRTHIHFYIDDYPNTIEGFKKSLKKHLQTTSYDRSDWSFQEKHDGSPVNSGCITYMTKGVLDPVFQKGFTQEELNTFKEQWVERPQRSSHQTKIQIIKRESAAESKKRKNDLVVEMIGKLGEYLQTDTNCLRHTRDEYTVKAIIQILNENSLVFGRYTVRDYYDTISARTKPDNYAYTMFQFCQFKSFT